MGVIIAIVTVVGATTLCWIAIYHPEWIGIADCIDANDTPELDQQYYDLDTGRRWKWDGTQWVLIYDPANESYGDTKHKSRDADGTDHGSG